MTQHDLTLEDILDALMLEEREPSYDALVRWTKRYPEHTDALARFFAVWAKQSSDDETVQDEDSLASRGVSYALDLLHRQDEAHAALVDAPPGVRLLKAAHAAGLTLAELARRADLDESVVVKLDRRRIHGLIPRLCLERIASAINAAIHRVRTMVTGPPIMEAGLAYKARGKPAPVTESFADAIKRSSLPEPTQRFWLDVIATAEKGEGEPE